MNHYTIDIIEKVGKKQEILEESVDNLVAIIDRLETVQIAYGSNGLKRCNVVVLNQTTGVSFKLDGEAFLAFCELTNDLRER